MLCMPVSVIKNNNMIYREKTNIYTWSWWYSYLYFLNFWNEQSKFKFCCYLIVYNQDNKTFPEKKETNTINQFTIYRYIDPGDTLIYIVLISETI